MVWLDLCFLFWLVLIVFLLILLLFVLVIFSCLMVGLCIKCWKLFLILEEYLLFQVLVDIDKYLEMNCCCILDDGFMYVVFNLLFNVLVIVMVIVCYCVSKVLEIVCDCYVEQVLNEMLEKLNCDWCLVLFSDLVMMVCLYYWVWNVLERYFFWVNYYQFFVLNLQVLQG